LTAINRAEEVQCYDPCKISQHSPTTEPSITAHWSRPHKGHFILILSCYKPALITNEHFS